MKIKAVLLIAFLCVATHHQAEFSFVAVGDTAYQGEPSIESYFRLIDFINETNPAFSIHVGDIWGASVCVKERYEEMVETFRRYEHPLVFTPGDNEWTDCDRHVYGDWDTTTRLELLRDVFFSTNQSLGAHPMELVRQSDVSAFSKFHENARWLHEGVLFVTLNITGSNNNLRINDLNMLTEANERNSANVAWLRDSFRIAMEQTHPAVVLVFHAEMFAGSGGQEVPAAYSHIVNEMKLASDLYGKPVLLVHGDQHRFTIDRPFSQFAGNTLALGNVVRLQVYGDPEVRAVRVGVNPETPWVFSFQPLYLE